MLGGRSGVELARFLNRSSREPGSWRDARILFDRQRHLAAQVLLPATLVLTGTGPSRATIKGSFATAWWSPDFRADVHNK